jgi:mannose-6-phosphate isomerase-like protein (cupin superfamily)
LKTSIKESNVTDTWVRREEDAEVVEELSLWMLADSSHTDGVLGANRLLLRAGTAGAKPHYHRQSAEAFYVLAGTLEMLVDNSMISVGKGGYVVVPAGVHHAFGAAAGDLADLFITLTPGVERFEYFRLLPKVLRGELPEQQLAEIHERYDVHFVDSPAWDTARALTRQARTPAP